MFPGLQMLCFNRYLKVTGLKKEHPNQTRASAPWYAGLAWEKPYFIVRLSGPGTGLVSTGVFSVSYRVVAGSISLGGMFC